MRLIIDGDYPMAFGTTILDRDLTLPIEDVRSAASGPGRQLPNDIWRDEETRVARVCINSPTESIVSR